MIPLKPDHDGYWRLNTYEGAQKKTLREGLKANNFTFPRDVRTSELIEVQQRIDRGLLHYNDSRTTDEELSRFIDDRHLQRPNTTSRKAMIAILMGADEAAGFDRFMDLPPELRERIYIFHLMSLPLLIFCPTQPPIARTNKLLRQEALPLFHRLSWFLLRVYFVTDGYKVGDNIIRGSLRPCYQTSQFLQTLRPTLRSTPSVGRLMITVKAASSEETHQGKGEDIVQLGFRKMPCSGFRFFAKSGLPRADAMIVSTKRLSEEHFNDGSTSEMGFNLEDIYKIRELLETAFFDSFKKCGDWE